QEPRRLAGGIGPVGGLPLVVPRLAVGAFLPARIGVSRAEEAEDGDGIVARGGVAGASVEHRKPEGRVPVGTDAVLIRSAAGQKQGGTILIPGMKLTNKEFRLLLEDRRDAPTERAVELQRRLGDGGGVDRR